MTYRPYPDRDRALRQLQRTRAAYRYGRFPQRYVLGVVPPTAETMEKVRGILDRTARHMALASYAFAHPIDLGKLTAA